jgi:hypothetical protein
MELSMNLKTIRNNIVPLATTEIDGTFVGIGGLICYDTVELVITVGNKGWLEDYGDATGNIGIRGLTWIAKQISSIIDWSWRTGYDYIVADPCSDKLESAYRYLERFGFIKDEHGCYSLDLIEYED